MENFNTEYADMLIEKLFELLGEQYQVKIEYKKIR